MTPLEVSLIVAIIVLVVERYITARKLLRGIANARFAVNAYVNTVNELIAGLEGKIKSLEDLLDPKLMSRRGIK